MSFLDIDRSEFEKSLIVNKDLQDIQTSLGTYDSNSVPTKLVTPIPGFCVKVRTKKGEKIFINVCHTEDIPKPKGFRIPMSIGNEREVFDKADNLCAAIDVAINTEFFEKVDPYNEVMMSTIIDGVANKHNLDLIVNEFHVLKNIKCKGKLERMNIEQRPPKSDLPKKPLISELESKPSKPKDSDKKVLVPDFNLLKVDKPQPYYASEIDLKNVLSKEEINVQMNDDRVYLTTNGKVHYELEFHFPELVNIDMCSVEFDKEDQILTIIAPLQK